MYPIPIIHFPNQNILHRRRRQQLRHVHAVQPLMPFLPTNKLIQRIVPPRQRLARTNRVRHRQRDDDGAGPGCQSYVPYLLQRVEDVFGLPAREEIVAAALDDDDVVRRRGGAGEGAQAFGVLALDDGVAGEAVGLDADMRGWEGDF